MLLDEISEMDTRLQAKLLRALQEREIDRLGGAVAVKVNVRILATTNRELPAEVARGMFREDLFCRPNVVSLRVPPLRERLGDVAALAEFGPQGSLAGTFSGPGSLIGAAAQAAYPDGCQAGIASLVGRRMDDVESDLIIETLSHTLGNRTHAATILGISIRALRNKLHDYAAQGVAVPLPAAGVAA